MFPVVSTWADAGDHASRELLLRSVEHLRGLVAEVSERLGLRDQVMFFAKTGGMFGRSRFFDAQLADALQKVVPQATERGLRISPAEAAALAAKY